VCDVLYNFFFLRRENCWQKSELSSSINVVRSLHLEREHRPASAASRRRSPSSASAGLGSLVGQTTTSLGAGSVVVVPVGGLHEVLEVRAVQRLKGAVEESKVADDSRGDEQDHEEDEEGEV